MNVQNKRRPWHLDMWTPVSRLIERGFPALSIRLADALRIQQPQGRPDHSPTRAWWNELLMICTLFALLCTVLGLVLKDVTWLWIAIVGSTGYGTIRYRQAMRKLERHRDQITAELPEFVQIVVIYLYAGYSVTAAIQNAAKREKNRLTPMTKLVQEAARQLSVQTPLAQVLHRMAVEADTSDMKSIVTVLLTYTTRGGDAMTDTLLEMSRQMWNKRLSLVRRKAEETTVMMIFPLILIFISILLIVGAPAVMFMKW